MAFSATGAEARVRNDDDYGYGGGVPVYQATTVPQQQLSNPQKMPEMMDSGPDGENKPKMQRRFEKHFGTMNYDLFISKSFYFFFFAAFGSLFPLFGVYFKQLGLNASQTGLLLGLRPFIEFFSAPFWGSLGDKWRKGKHLLLGALASWILFTMVLAFIHPPCYACIRYNGTHLVMVDPWYDTKDPVEAKREKRSLVDDSFFSIEDIIFDLDLADERQKRSDGTDLILNNFDGSRIIDDDKGMHVRVRREDDDDDDEGTVPPKIKFHKYMPRPNIKIIGKSPLPVDWESIVGVDQIRAKGLVTPPFSSQVYKSYDVKKTFLLLLFMFILGEFFCAPALTLADSATVGYLMDNPEGYGRQRLFGSIGWGCAMFIMGFALDHSNIFHNHPCGDTEAGERNYTVCFAMFAIMMVLAFITATQFKFKYDGIPEQIQLDNFKNKTQKVFDTVQQKIGGMKVKKSAGRDPMANEFDYDSGQPMQRSAYEIEHGQSDPSQPPLHQDNIVEPMKPVQINLHADDGTGKMVQDVVRDPNEPAVEHSSFIPRGTPGQSGTMPGWVSVLRMMANVHYGSVLYITWFMGFGVGLLFTFLFWHLQDINGTPTLFGIVSVLNHASEIAAFVFSKRLIAFVGHIRILYIALCGNVVRFFYISWIRTPGVVVIFEPIQGLTHGVVWAACCSYITQASPPQLRTSAQAFLQAIFHGFGRGSGCIIGGFLVSYFGTEYTFRGYGIVCIIVLVALFAINYWFRVTGLPGAMDTEPEDVLEESSHLAPCGVPMNPAVTRNLSSSNLQDTGAKPQYGTHESNGYLDSVPQQQQQQQQRAPMPKPSQSVGQRPPPEDDFSVARRPYSSAQSQRHSGGDGYGY